MLESGALTTITFTNTASTTFTGDEERNTRHMCRSKLYNRLTNGDKTHHHGILFAVLHSHNIWERLYEADPDREVVFTKNVWRAIYFQR
jgi:hypothetical protein